MLQRTWLKLLSCVNRFEFAKLFSAGSLITESYRKRRAPESNEVSRNLNHAVFSLLSVRGVLGCSRTPCLCLASRDVVAIMVAATWSLDIYNALVVTPILVMPSTPSCRLVTDSTDLADDTTLPL